MHYKFNVAFVQIQLVTTIQNLPENRRTAEQLETAAAGLESAIESLDAIATLPQTPYPKHDIEQRANMARNTLRKQLERAIAKQKEWEEKNKEKIQAAKEQREAELKRREEQRQEILEKERERQEKIRKEREAIAIRDRALAEQRAEEERQKQELEMTTDAETGEKVKRKSKAAGRTGEGRPKKTPKKKKAARDEDDSEEESHTKKRRRLTKKESSKFKSAEIVVDSDDEHEDDDDALERAEREMERDGMPASDDDDDLAADKMDVDEDDAPARSGAEDEDEDNAARQAKRSRRGRIVEESDEEE